MINLFKRNIRRDAGYSGNRKSASWIFGGGNATWRLKGYNTYADEGYNLNPIVNACVQRIANGIGSVDIIAQAKDKKGNVTEVTSNHPLQKLINRPNGAQNMKRILRDMASYYLIGGNAYLLGSGIEKGIREPKELLLLPPQSIKVNKGNSILYPQSFEYKQANNTAIIYPVDQITGNSAVLHSKTFNAFGELEGMPPMAAAAYGIDIFNKGQEWNKALLDNGARPSGALMVKNADGTSQNLSEEQYTRLKSQISDQYSGGGNAGRPLLLEGGLEWKEMSMSPRDMDHAANMITNAKFVAAVYNVPPQLVNIPGESTFSNYREAIQFLWTDTILPLLGILLEDINNWLMPMYGDGAYLWYDESMIPALESKRAEKLKALQDISYMTINEKREAVGMEATLDGDTLLVPSTSVPLYMAGIQLPEVGSQGNATPK